MSQAPTRYIRSIDGLRAVSILLVITGGLHWGYPFIGHGQAQLGVIVFFTISGFVITRILVEDKARGWGPYLRTFYTRRSLRIFPLYFFYLAVGGALGALGSAGLNHSLENIRAAYADGWPWLWSYTYNLKPVYQILARHPGPPSESLFGHLWSLCVEEQFYLVFPFVVFLLGRPALRRLFWVLLIAVPLLRIGLYAALYPRYGMDPAFLVNYLLMPTNLDALLAGGLVALGVGNTLARPAGWLAVVVAMLVLVVNVPVLYYLGIWGHPMVKQVYYNGVYGGTVLAAALAILACVQGGNWAAHLLAGRLPVAIGKVTYGMYVWHYLVVLALRSAFVRLGVEQAIRARPWLEVPAFLLYLCLLYAVCRLSFSLLEEPFLRLKDRWAPTRHPSLPKPETA